MIPVPNFFPRISSDKRIAIIGEAPGTDEETSGRPFSGKSGNFLAALLSRAGVQRDACFLGNVCQYRPPNNDISKFSWSSDEVQTGLYQLKKDLETYKPSICILLGNIPLKAAKDPLSHHPLLAKCYENKISNWRGSLFLGVANGPMENLKCIASYHPTYCLRDYESTPMLQFDIYKAVREATSPVLSLPQRHFRINVSIEDQVLLLREIRRNRLPVALDIEGGIDTMSCISFATSANEAFIIPFYNKSGHYLSTPEVWRELALTLEDENVPKILQNSLYDRFVLHYSYGIRVRNVVDDTMLKHWELCSELEKSLGVQASIYTDEPFYKGDRKSSDDKQFYEYCCRDSAVTYEISQKLESKIRGSSKEHYQLNIGLLNPLLFMEVRGIRYDELGAKNRRSLLQQKLYEAQARLNALTGYGFSFRSLNEIKNHAYEKFYTKKKDRVRKEFIEEAILFDTLLRQSSPNLATIGEIEDLCEVSLNVGSNKQLCEYLYDQIKLPEQMSIPPRGDPKPPHRTADYEALLKLSRICQQEKRFAQHMPLIQAIIEIRALQTRQQMLSISADRDGRIRCGYNIVGSNTGRITCYESPTGSGYNLQTIPNYTDLHEAPGQVLGDRDLFLADEDHWLFQCDLSGADGWTVAAYSAMLGDPNMLEDYKAGLKPANILALILRGICTENTSREVFKEHHKNKTIKKDDWDYFACKRVQHGCSYLEGGLTVSRNILKDSEGKLYKSPSDCDKLKDAFFTRYWGIKKWHDWVARRLRERPILVAASGQVRQFFGRPDDILTKAVAFEPQANTTYATNLAAWKLWTDYDNRKSTSVNDINESRTTNLDERKSSSVNGYSSGCTLRIEPLHQVHDALLGQFLKQDSTWAVGKIKQWFNNPLMIAGQSIVIPFEGNYGRAWGDLNEGKI